MSYRLSEDEDAVLLAPSSASASASVIWLHGLGADGHDFVPIVPDLRLPPALAVRFVFPHAPVRAVSLNHGAAMRAWYDIKVLSIDSAEDADGIADSATRIDGYLRRERALGIAANRIVIAGFSQGGAMALYSGLRCEQTLAGVLALSTYLPLRQRLAAEASAANRNTSILMCHGRQDPVVPLQYAMLSRDALMQQGYAVQWQEYPMQHEVCAQELADIAAWLRQRLA
ncbi:MAG TPA: alpha/beta fold hydrolase [Steroidobacteraceae bacterium]|jgi:phospholipase/carboxylesterase